MAAASLVVRLSAQIAEFQKSFTEAAHTAEKFSNNFEGVATRASAVGTFIGEIGADIAKSLARGLGQAVTDAIRLSSEFSNAFIGLSSVARAFGVDADLAKAAAARLSSDGLLPLKDSATGLKNLLAAGFDLEQSIKLMDAFKDSAAFGRQSSLSFGDAVRSATEGVKNGNSILVDNAGVTKNLSNILVEAGFSAQDLSKASTDAGIRMALFNGIIRETAAQTGDAERLTKTYSGQVSRLGSAYDTMLASLGMAITQNATVAEAIGLVSDSIVGTTRVMSDNRNAFNLISDAVIVFVRALAETAKVVDVTQSAFHGFVVEVNKVVTGVVNAGIGIFKFIERVEKIQQVLDPVRFQQHAAAAEEARQAYTFLNGITETLAKSTSDASRRSVEWGSTLGAIEGRLTSVAAELQLTRGKTVELGDAGAKSGAALGDGIEKGSEKATAAMKKAQAAAVAYAASVRSLADQLGDGFKVDLADDVKKLEDALRLLGDEGRLSAAALNRAGEAAEKLREGGARLSPELQSLAVKTQAFSEWLNKVKGQEGVFAGHFEDLRNALPGFITPLKDVQVILDEIENSRAFARMRDELPLGELQSVEVALRQIKDAQDKLLKSKLKEVFRDAFESLPDILIDGFKNGRLLDAIKQFGLNLARDITRPLMESLSSAQRASVTAGSTGASLLGGAVGGGTGAQIGGAAASLGGAALGALGVTGVALGAATLGIGAAAVAVYALVKALNEPTDYEKRVRANAAATKELTEQAVGAAGSIANLQLRAQLVGVDLDAAFKSGSAEFLHKVLGELDGKFKDLQKEIATTWQTFADGAVGSGELLDASLAPFIRQLQSAGGITEELADKLTGFTKDNSASWQHMQGLAEKYGIALDGLGATFQQQKLTETASQIIRDFDLLIRNGADFNAVLSGMKDEINQVVLDSLKFGTEIPENMRPWIQKLIDTGLLLDSTGTKITNIDTLKFGPVIKSDIQQLNETIQKLIEALTTGVGGAVDALNRRSVRIPVVYEVNDSGLQTGTSGIFSVRDSQTQTINVNLDGNVIARSVVRNMPSELELNGL